jgi:hypothetical protein
LAEELLNAPDPFYLPHKSPYSSCLCTYLIGSFPFSSIALTMEECAKDEIGLHRYLEVYLFQSSQSFRAAKSVLSRNS